MKIPALDVSLASLGLLLLGTEPMAQQRSAVLAPGTPVPRELALAGGAGPALPGASASLTMFPACAKAIEDMGGPGCLYGSSVPALGKLYPLSANLFVDAATGNVGIGTTNPLERLHVEGVSRFDDDTTILGHETLWGNLIFPVRSGIVFPAVNFAGYPPMITMFDGGSSSLDRMVIAHSPAFPEWGLQYQDSTDRFVFQSTALGIPVPTLVIDLGASVTSVVPFTATKGVIASSSVASGVVLDVDGTAASYSQVVTLDRTTVHASGNDLLQLQILAGSSVSSQYIECQQTNGDLDFRVDGDGEVFSDVGITTPADFAEMIQVTSGAGSVEPGDLVVIDPARPRAVVRSTRAYSTLVAGVYSTKPGVVGTEREWDAPAPEGSAEALAGERIPLKRADMARLYDEVPVAVVGIVPCKVSAENGPIQPGDLLVSSSTPGHAMRADAPSVGTVVGKALEPLASGTGRIRILVTLQ